MEEKNPIKELFTNTGPFDEEAVVKALKPLISIREGTYEIYFIGEDMKVDDKILAFALAKKLLHSRKYREEGYISAVEIHKDTGLPKGSIDFSFKSLRENGYLVGKGKTYEIPNYRISQVIERLTSLIK